MKPNRIWRIETARTVTGDEKETQEGPKGRERRSQKKEKGKIGERLGFAGVRKKLKQELGTDERNRTEPENVARGKIRSRGEKLQGGQIGGNWEEREI